MQEVVVGLIGCGGRGRHVARHMRNSGGVRFTAFADVYDPNAQKAAGELGDGKGQTYKDFRQLLERKDLHAVIVANTDHWHAISTVLACEAGKHVYVEKPLSHNIREGRAMVNAARRYKRIVETGTQQRSAPHFPDVAEMVQSGKLGMVHYVRVWNFFNRHPQGIGRAPDSEPPEGLDWDFYLGPAPKVPYNRMRFLGSFRHFWDYASGMITDYGTHRMDTVHQIMGVDAPRTIVATGGRYALQGAGEMPDVLQVSYEYPGFALSYEFCALNGHGIGGRTPGMKYYNMKAELDRPHGMAFYGTDGTIYADRVSYEIYPEKGSGLERKTAMVKDATDRHAKNFAEAVRGNSKPVADVELGHRATTVGLLGNISYLTGHKLTWDPRKEECIGDPEANRLLGRAARKPWDLIS